MSKWRVYNDKELLVSDIHSVMVEFNEALTEDAQFDVEALSYAVFAEESKLQREAGSDEFNLHEALDNESINTDLHYHVIMKYQKQKGLRTSNCFQKVFNFRLSNTVSVAYL